MSTSANKIKVTYFQRRPRPGFNFSLEYIFNDVRKRLKDKIDARVEICSFFNNGFFTKTSNIIEAGLRQRTAINHITGEVHFLNLLMRKNTVILSILDCGMIHSKRGIAQLIVKKLYLTWPVRSSKFITCISEATKQEVIKYTICAPQKITVIPVAVDPLYQPSPKEFNTRCPNILHIGITPNKNIFRLIKALEGIQCHLTIVGKLTQAHINNLNQRSINYSNFYDLSQQQMLEKYHECDILSFVSTLEGFGMPIIEANSVERVVITSNISSMPEVAGDSACLVDPYNIADIKNGLLKIISDDDYRNELIKRGKKNRLRFNADMIAKKYYELYKKMNED